MLADLFSGAIGLLVATALGGRATAVMGLVLVLGLPPPARAAPPASAQTEINYLLAFVGNSGCGFFRNGGWYDAKQAEAHLRYKYEMLAARDRINTAEDFIEKAATKSSVSAQPYQVRCSGAEAVTSNQWLRDALARYRAHTGLAAPRVRRPPDLAISLSALGNRQARSLRLASTLRCGGGLHYSGPHRHARAF
jgi:hypothetical protein